MARVLLIDDDLTTLEGFERLLRLEDFDVTTCTSGREAVENIRRAWFDVILADLRLPDMTGVRLLELIRVQERVTTPFIIVA